VLQPSYDVLVAVTATLRIINSITGDNLCSKIVANHSIFTCAQDPFNAKQVTENTAAMMAHLYGIPSVYTIEECVKTSRRNKI
jgi:hypothetical protein